MKKLYIDVTESYIWRGKVTGIIRVMDELSSRFIDDKKITPTFIIWEEKPAAFREVDFTEVLDDRKRDHQADNFDDEPIDRNKPAYVAGMKVPFSRTARRALRLSKKNLTKRPARKKGLDFKPGSLLFMPHGGVWGSKKYAAKVFELQEQSGLRLVPILYDLCPVISPQFCSKGVRRVFNRYMKDMLVRADLVLAISKNTAQDARTWTSSLSGGKPAPIKVFRLGDEIGDIAGVRTPKIKLPNEFIICVGTIEARKNHAGLYYAYKLAKQKNIKLPSVVVVGRKGWLTKDIYEIISTDPDTKNKFIFLHDAHDNELAWLYAHARLSVYPSFYEGWGLPVAESLLHGVPCVASNTSSIPEIAGNLIDYFSPYSPEEIMNKLGALSYDTKLLERKRKKIKAGYKTTSWDDTYRQVSAALAKV